MEGLSELVAPFVTAAQSIDLEKDELDVMSASSQGSGIQDIVPTCHHGRTPTVFTALSLSSTLIATS